VSASALCSAASDSPTSSARLQCVFQHTSKEADGPWALLVLLLQVWCWRKETSFYLGRCYQAHCHAGIPEIDAWCANIIYFLWSVSWACSREEIFCHREQQSGCNCSRGRSSTGTTLPPQCETRDAGAGSCQNPPEVLQLLQQTGSKGETAAKELTFLRTYLRCDGKRGRDRWPVDCETDKEKPLLQLCRAKHTNIYPLLFLLQHFRLPIS